MNFDDNISEVFDNYLRGQMTEVEEREFVEQLKNDPSLKQAYETHRTIVAGIRNARKKELKEYIKKNAKIRYIGNVWNSKWVMTSAAIFVIFFSAYIIVEYVVKPASSEKIAATEEATEKDQQEIVEKNKNKTPTTIDIAEDDKNLTEKATSKPVLKKTVPLLTKRSEIDLNKVAKSKNFNETIDIYYEVATTTQYRYSNDKLTLYKFPYKDEVVVYTDDDIAYLAWQRAYYPLIKDDKAHPLQKLTDKKIIRQLHPLQ